LAAVANGHRLDVVHLGSCMKIAKNTGRCAIDREFFAATLERNCPGSAANGNVFVPRRRP
jgi:hypothetical protein